MTAEEYNKFVNINEYKTFKEICNLTVGRHFTKEEALIMKEYIDASTMTHDYNRSIDKYELLDAM
jgi:hypothetical protein